MFFEPANRKMNRSISSFVAVSLAILMFSSAPWFLLQSIAWSRMFFTFAQHDALSIAVKKTLDGRHPCALCVQIRQGQREEAQKNSHFPRVKPEKTPELFCNESSMMVTRAPDADFERPAFRLDCHAGFFEPPPTPPPRVKAEVL